MLYKLLIDFGLVILIWMTQLVVYPSFTYFSEADLLSWHQKYTSAISIIVMPLMLAQVAAHGYFMYAQLDLWKVLAAVLIGLIWINTFMFAVPLHHKIGSGQEMMEAAQGLVRVNWPRTFLWSMVFLIDLYDYVKNQGSGH